MNAKIFAMANGINDYPEEVSDIVGTLIEESKKPSNKNFREWIEDRLTMFANFKYLDPEVAEKLPDETREQIRFLMQKPAKVFHIRPQTN